MILRDGAPAQLQGADIECAALQADQLFQIDRQGGHGHTIIGGAGARAAGAIRPRSRAPRGIAPQFIHFLNVKADAVSGHPIPRAPHVAQQVVTHVWRVIAFFLGSRCLCRTLGIPHRGRVNLFNQRP
ncbi:hypothetical protein NBRC3278_2334 [Acetobacter pasteurianus NBRC 3278]|uniref:Uncharacterized protein n=1 Tax=Acetobacter pasteurianus NBRC 3278 TaxID=1226660 RepID=A0A401X5S6_ACEPA|nr:hypothetical protein NBRC3278_2334 [Acetobacter pasteurianus NBRC 3278]GCD66875.1 hypothetical protein NBRC3279_2366 [Acetobacter pasteurianus NBRC 3279]GCD73206.1 hypothetical protein NBRC3284_2362 [Acetobacter pasteurianus NBRC 3284]